MDEGYDDEEENFEIIEEIELDDEEPNAGILCRLDHIIHMATGHTRVPLIFCLQWL